MCGIVGIYRFDRERSVDVADVAAMCGVIHHRGPDAEGRLIDGSVGLGMRRLSIIDLENGQQPVYNEDRSLAVVFNGEIYNYRQLRTTLSARGHQFATNSDTEAIVHAYEEYGEQCVNRLNGMFAFAIYDRRRRSLFVARDHLGIKPLYYWETADEILFASEVKALLTQRQVHPAVDPDALVEYVQFGYVSGPRTMFHGLRKLPAAHFMRIDACGSTIRQYWSPPLPSDEDHGFSHYADQLRDAMKDAVHRQMVSDVPLGAFLSGGLDSSSIVHMMGSRGGEVKTYSIGFGKKYGFHDELADARLVADVEHTAHHEIVAEPNIVDLLPKLVWHLDEPVADSSYIVTYLVSQLASESVKVILSGVGGDELFGGYRRYLAFTLNRYFSWMPVALRRHAEHVLSRLPTSRDTAAGNLTRLARSFLASLNQAPESQYRSLLAIFNPDVLATQRSRPPDDTFASALFTGELGKGDMLEQMQRYDVRHSLVDDLLLLTDKMTMACSLESRVPLLDLELVEIAFRIPSKYKVTGRQLRRIQFEAMKNQLPAATLVKKKRGFGCPVGAWVKRDLREYIQDMLAPSRLARHGLFDDQVVARTLADHYAGRADHTDQIMSLLTFETWHDIFVHEGVSQASLAS